MKTIRLLALLTFGFLFLTALRAGFTRATTDFPNYYTAAVLVRQRQPLRLYYDWTWFQRQMNEAGAGLQLGAYNPQTPLTMMPFVPLAGLPVQRAKQVWLICNLGFLLGTIWLLSRVTRFSIDHLWLIAFCGYFSLYTNFLLGQYYVFLLFLLTLSFWLLQRGRATGSGCGLGTAFALKLYGGPFLLYFLARRKWKAVAGMAITVLALGVVALAIFGYDGVRYYLTQVLPRSLEGGSIDPYNPNNSTMAALLRRLFMRDISLNPHPLLEAPRLFFFLRTVFALAVAGAVVIGSAMRPSTERQDFAWFCVAVLLLSSSLGSYSFVLVLLPIVLLMEEAGPLRRVLLFGCYLLLVLPLRPASLFLKVWLLLTLFALAAGRRNWRTLPRSVPIAAALVIVLVASVDAGRHIRSYRQEPAQRFEPVAVERGAMFSAFPVITRGGLFYQFMARDRYVLRWIHNRQTEDLTFEGHALRPFASSPDGPVYFELVANRHSTMMQLDWRTRTISPADVPVQTEDLASVVSADGKWAVRVAEDRGSQQLLLRDVTTGEEKVATGGNCNNFSPSWELDSKAIVFASDCGRGFGLPVLYRMPIERK